RVVRVGTVVVEDRYVGDDVEGHLGAGGAGVDPVLLEDDEGDRVGRVDGAVAITVITADHGIVSIGEEQDVLAAEGVEPAVVAVEWSIAAVSEFDAGDLGAGGGVDGD